MRRLAALTLVVAACSSTNAADPQTPELAEIDVAGFNQLLADLDQPAVVNIWASWCLPCRSEAPLLRQAHAEFGDRVAFIGINTQDAQAPARQFLDEFQLDFPNYFDPDGRVPAALGGIGVPRTYFVAPGGEIVKTHSGILDEQTLALQIDELLNR